MYVYGVFIRKKQKSNINLDFDTQQLDIYLDDSGFFVFSSKDRYDFFVEIIIFLFLYIIVHICITYLHEGVDKKM